MTELARELPHEICTARLRLRPPQPSDASAINAAILESFAELNAWMEWATTPPTLADTRAFCERAAQEIRDGSGCPLLMLDAADGSVVGASGYAHIDWDVPAFEIGYWCRTPCCGRGYATEVTAALTRHAFEALDARRVQVRMDDRNTRSAAVPERLGFRLEGVLHNEVRDHHGRLRDTRVYALLELSELRQHPPPR